MRTSGPVSAMIALFGLAFPRNQSIERASSGIRPGAERKGDRQGTVKGPTSRVPALVGILVPFRGYEEALRRSRVVNSKKG